MNQINQFRKPPPLFETVGQPVDWAADLSSPRTRLDNYKYAIEQSIIDPQRIRQMAGTGIPEDMRPTYWAVLLEYLPKERSKWVDTRRQKQEHYFTFVKDFPFDKASDNPNSKEVLRRIDMDIPRTMPSLHYFASHDGNALLGMNITMGGNVIHLSPRQIALRRVLYIFTQLNPGLGYVQGMNELVAHLFYPFSHMCENDDEAEAFAFHTFQTLMSHLGDNFCRVLDRDKNVGVGSSLGVFTALVATIDPELYYHLASLQVLPEFYAFRWITLFMSQEFQVPEVLRIWDYLFSDLTNVMCMVYYVALSMLVNLRSMLLNMSFGECVQTLQQYPPDVDVDLIVRKAELEIRPRLPPDFVQSLHQQQGACQECIDRALISLRPQATLKEKFDEKLSNFKSLFKKDK